MLTPRQEANRRYYLKRKAKNVVRPETERKMPLTLRLPASLVGRIQRLVNLGIATGRYPWKTLTAAFQGLVVKGLESMANDPEVEEMTEYLQISRDLEDWAALRRETKAAVAKFRIEISELQAIGARDAAVRLFRNFRDQVRAMQASEWRDWALTTIEKAYPALLKAEPKRVSMRMDPHHRELEENRPRVRIAKRYEDGSLVEAERAERDGDEDSD